MGKDLHEKPFDDATRTKLEIFEKYVEAWLPVFFKNEKAFIVDFFAGPGKDIDGTSGSPLRIIDKIFSYKNKINNHQVVIETIFNEFDPKKFDRLQKNIDSVREKHCSIPILHNMDFNELFVNLRPKFEKNPSLLFMDQNGFKFITKSVLNALDQFNKTDFMFFISSSYFNRFSDDPTLKAYHPDFPTEILKEDNFNSVHRKILEYYRSILSPQSEFKLYPFSLKKDKNIYGLIFGTKHILGVDKFLDIAWKINPLNGEANFDIDDDQFKKENRSLFSELIKKTKIDVFEEELIKFIAHRKKVTNKDIYTFSLLKGFTHKHAVDVIKDLIKKDRVKKNFLEKKGEFIGYNQCYSPKRVIKEYEWIS